MIETLGITAVSIFGFCYIIGHSTISFPLRTLMARNRFGAFVVSLMECPACASFHSGWIVFLGSDFFWLGPKTIVGAFASGCFFAGTSYLLARLTGITPSPSLPSERHIEDFFPPSP